MTDLLLHRAALLAKLLDVDARLANVAPPERPTGDEGDRRAHALAEALAIDERARLSRQRREIVEAIGRVDGGCYGRCLDCDGVIPDARLKAVPDAETCIGCAARRERTRSAL